MDTTNEECATLDNIYTMLMQTQKDIKNLTKNVRKINAQLEDPDGEKRAERAKNNGFNRPQKISPELVTFLGLPADSLLSRSDVTRQINVYITEKGLKHPDNGRVIMIEKDAHLQTLLQVPDDIQLTYLNIQRYLGVHYVKEPAADKTETPAADKTETPAEETKTETPAEEIETKAPPATTKKPTVTKKKPTVRKPVAATS